MPKRLVCAMLALLLMLSGVALAENNTDGLPTGTVLDATTVYDGTWSNANVVGVLQPGAGVIVLQHIGDWLQVFARAERIVGWVAPGTVDVQYDSPIFPGIVIAQSISLRESPSTRAKRIASLPNGAMFDLLDEQNGWYRVSYWDGKSQTPLEGWVLVDFVVRDPSFITTTKATYVYATPSRSSKKVGELVSGSQVVVIAEFGDFWVVNLRSATGFIYKKDVEENYLNGGNG